MSKELSDWRTYNKLRDDEHKKLKVLQPDRDLSVTYQSKRNLIFLCVSGGKVHIVQKHL